MIHWKPKKKMCRGRRQKTIITIDSLEIAFVDILQKVDCVSSECSAIQSNNDVEMNERYEEDTPYSIKKESLSGGTSDTLGSDSTNRVKDCK